MVLKRAEDCLYSPFDLNKNIAATKFTANYKESKQEYYLCERLLVQLFEFQQ